jgi:hypothetical protein
MIAPRRIVKQRLGRAVPALSGAFYQQLAHHLGAWRTTGLTRCDDGMAALFQLCLEVGDLGRLPRSLTAFQRNETPR